MRISECTCAQVDFLHMCAGGFVQDAEHRGLCSYRCRQDNTHRENSLLHRPDINHARGKSYQ